MEKQTSLYLNNVEVTICNNTFEHVYLILKIVRNLINEIIMIAAGFEYMSATNKLHDLVFSIKFYWRMEFFNEI